MCNAGSGSFKSQLKRADKSGAAFAFILGESELDNNEITVKPLLKSLQDDFQQQTLAQDALSEFIAEHIINMV
jgi:histidyl-tRNA synthetase